MKIFCTLKNGIFFLKLFRPTLRKIVLVIKKNFWNSKLKAENLKIQMGKIIGIYKHAGKI